MHGIRSCIESQSAARTSAGRDLNARIQKAEERDPNIRDDHLLQVHMGLGPRDHSSLPPALRGACSELLISLNPPPFAMWPSYCWEAAGTGVKGFWILGR